MSLGENTGYELLLCLGRGDVVTVTRGGGGDWRVESQAARAGKTDVMTH